MNTQSIPLFGSVPQAPRGPGYGYLPGQTLSSVTAKPPVATFGTASSPVQIGRPVAHPIGVLSAPGNAVNSPIVAPPVAYPVSPVQYPQAGPINVVPRIGSGISAPIARPVSPIARVVTGLFR